MKNRPEQQFAPRLTPAALAELDAFHATSIDRWMERRAVARVATMETAPRSAWAIVEAKFRYDSGLLRKQDPYGDGERRMGR